MIKTAMLAASLLVADVAAILICKWQEICGGAGIRAAAALYECRHATTLCPPRLARFQDGASVPA